MHANLNDRKQVESFYSIHTHMGLYAHKHCPLVLSYTATLLARSKYSTVNKPGTLPKIKRKKNEMKMKYKERERGRARRRGWRWNCSGLESDLR